MHYRLIIDDNAVGFIRSVRDSLAQGWRFEVKDMTMRKLISTMSTYMRDHKGQKYIWQEILVKD